MSILSSHYESGHFFDEMFVSPTEVRPHYQRLAGRLGTLPVAEFDQRRAAVDLAFLRRGVTFTVYHDDAGTERIFPFDLIPPAPKISAAPKTSPSSTCSSATS